MECGAKINGSPGADIHDVVAHRSEISQSADSGGAKMHDVVVQKSRISQEAKGSGDSRMHHVSGNNSQFGQASVGSIHIGGDKRSCTICGNYISSDNRSLVCMECGSHFCETCETFFRTERKRGEIPLCQECFGNTQILQEQEQLRKQQEEERRQKELAARQPQAGQVWTSPSSIEFVFIPAGTFLMGSAELDNAIPHQVTLSKPFYLGKYQVTQREWAMVMGHNPSEFKGDTRPVETISWNDCQEFIRKLNAREGVNKYRLPTEAEWEYACRAGSRARFCFGDGDHILPQYAWFGDNAGDETHPVGKLNPNDWGLYDMHGNVWEWCYDWYGGYPARSVTDPSGVGSGSVRVIRGGSWNFFAENCSSADRYGLEPGFRCSILGLRLLRSL